MNDKYIKRLHKKNGVTVGHFFRNKILKKHSRPCVSGQRLPMVAPINCFIVRNANVATRSIAPKSYVLHSRSASLR